MITEEGEEGQFFELGEGFHLSSCWRGGGGAVKLYTYQTQCVSFIKLTVIYPNISADVGTVLHKLLNCVVKY
jgi:hypothetical protein